MRIAIVSLSSCQGCQMAFLSLEDYLYSFMDENNLAYVPLLLSERDLPEVDLALVEGTVGNGDHFKRAREARARAQQLVALGTCACFGGVQGLGDRYTEEGLMRRRFGKGASFEDSPQAVKRLLPLDSYIGVDAYLPGCPPPIALLKSFLELTLSGALPSRDGATVCAECNVASLPLPQPGPRRISAEEAIPGKCLLEQGFLCMGPLTRDGCGAECPSQYGVPCTGCRGPSRRTLTEPSCDPALESIRRLARATRKRPLEISEAIKDPAQSFFMHCLAEPLLRRRRPAGTSSFIRRLGEK
jgi:F420-non-reducing hydrogenase small subunit